MSGAPLPKGRAPSRSQATEYLAHAEATLKGASTQLASTLLASRLCVERLMSGTTTDASVLRALRVLHRRCLALQQPVLDMEEDLLALTIWAERASDWLGVPLVDTEPGPADLLAQVEAWLGATQGEAN